MSRGTLATFNILFFRDKKQLTMTLKQQRLINAILSKDNIGKPLKEIAESVGLTSTHIYKKAIKSHILEAFKEKGISKDTLTHSFEALTHLCLKDKDYSNAHRGLENIAKLSGLLKADNTITINQANVLDSIRASDRAEATSETTHQCTTHKSATHQCGNAMAGQG